MIYLDGRWISCWDAWRIGLLFWQAQVIIASQVLVELLGGPREQFLTSKVLRE